MLIRVIERLARGGPGGATGQAALFQQQHIRPAQLGEMIGRADASDAAADNDDTGLAG